MSEILEALTKIEVWVSLCLGIVVPWLLKHLRLKSVQLMQRLPEFKGKAANSIEKWIRGRIKKDLLKVKAKRFDQAAITREISKANTALIIFGVLTGVWMIFVITQRLQGWQLVLAILPALLAEIIWVLESSDVSTLLESARRLRQNKSRVEKLLRQRDRLKSELAEAAIKYRHLTTPFNTDVILDESLEGGSVWLWTIRREANGLFQCVAGYDFTYTFDKSAGNKTPRFRMTGKDFPSRPSWDKQNLKTKNILINS
ncbi:hypothetical protein [Pseudomonas tohonis]|uniref:hypothetical protein n=1 Tax=Pseudomonas tohonis TaxID=2725477 RepID=UPI001F24BE3E|nr:hypothetical protein [Pseudomonas tohonis]